MGEVVHTIPTVGFNVETVNYKNINFNVWDIGGQTKLRNLWRHYYTGSQALIFVVDSIDAERMQEASESLHMVLNDEDMKDASVLVFANKQDLPGAMNVPEITDKLGLA